MASSRALDSLPSLDIAPVVRITRDAAVEAALVALQTEKESSAAVTYDPGSCFICGGKVKKGQFEVEDEPDLAKQVDLFKVKLRKEDPTCDVRKEMVPCSNCVAILVKQVWEMDKVIKSINGQITQMLKRSLKLMDETNRRNKKIIQTAELNTSRTGDKVELIAPPKSHPSTVRSPPPRVKIRKPRDLESRDSFDSDEEITLTHKLLIRSPGSEKIEPQRKTITPNKSSHHKILNGTPTDSRNRGGNNKRKHKFEEDDYDNEDDLFVRHVRRKSGAKQQDNPLQTVSESGLNPRNTPHSNRVENSVRQEVQGHKETEVKGPKTSNVSRISTLPDPSPTGNKAIGVNSKATYFPIFENIRHQRTKKSEEETTKARTRGSPRGKGPVKETASFIPPVVKSGRKTMQNVVKEETQIGSNNGNEMTFSFSPQPSSRSISVDNSSTRDDITIKMEDCQSDEILEELLPLQMSDGIYSSDILQNDVPVRGSSLSSTLEKIKYEIPKKGEFLLNPFKDLSHTRVDGFTLTTVQKSTEKTTSRNNSFLTETGRKDEVNSQIIKIPEPYRTDNNFRVSFHVPKISFSQFNVNNQGPIQIGFSPLHTGLDFGLVEQSPCSPPAAPPIRQRASISTVVMSPKQKSLDVAPIQNPANKITSFRCEICKKYFQSQANLEIHVQTGHAKPDETFVCRKCNKDFYDRRSLEDHKRMKHDNDGFACSICNKVLATRRICAIHEVTVCNVSPENEKITKLGLKFKSCGFSGCKKLFYQCSETELERHEATHKVKQGPIIGWSSLANQEFPCAKCGKRFALKFTRQRHEKSCNNIMVID